MILIKSFKVLCLPIFEFQNNLNISFFLFGKSAQAIVSQDNFMVKFESWFESVELQLYVVDS